MNEKDRGTNQLLWVLVLCMAFFLLNCGGASTGENSAGTETPPRSASAVACPEADPVPAGNTYFLDPVNGSIGNPGTRSRPWGRLQDVIENNMITTRSFADLPYDGTNDLRDKNPDAPVKPGDTLVLLDGFHGAFSLQGAYNLHTITVRAAAGHRPTLSRIRLSAAARWRFEGLTVSPSEAPVYAAGTLITVESHGFHGPSRLVTIENCELYSVQDASGWSSDDWNDLACNAISVSGDCMTIRDNSCMNINFGITVSGNNALVGGNTVDGFAGDGMRGLGNDLVFEYNLIKNCYAVNGNHDDGFQSWSINEDPPRERVTLRGNTFINYEDPNQPHRGALQGIGCFDGPYIDWVVENNLVVTDHWHGISLYGAFNSRIVNNTVVDLNDTRPGPPWIGVFPHKDDTPSQGCVIRNNIAASFTASGDTIADHNLQIDRSEYLEALGRLFINPAAGDYHLKTGSDDAIDAGSAALAPAVDMEGTNRPRGGGVDLGCYEN